MGLKFGFLVVISRKMSVLNLNYDVPRHRNCVAGHQRMFSDPFGYKELGGCS